MTKSPTGCTSDQAVFEYGKWFTEFWDLIGGGYCLNDFFVHETKYANLLLDKFMEFKKELCLMNDKYNNFVNNLMGQRRTFLILILIGKETRDRFIHNLFIKYGEHQLSPSLRISRVLDQCLGNWIEKNEGLLKNVNMIMTSGENSQNNYCPKCLTKNENDENICNYCGTHFFKNADKFR